MSAYEQPGAQSDSLVQGRLSAPEGALLAFHGVAQSLVLGPPRRRWPRRILIGLNIVVALCLVATASAYGYLKFRFGQIDRLSIPGLRNDGDDDPGQPMNVLFVGSDSRKNISKAEQRAFGTERQVGGERSDTIIVLHVDPRQEKAAILSIPRDLLVPIAGSGRMAKINSAFEGGPERLIATIKGALRIEIDHYVEVDFNGFRDIVDSIGGVKVYFSAPARDRYTGLNVRTPGCVQLDGDRALQYVRSRHYQYYEGRWREDVRADLGRIERQQDFIRRVMHKAVRSARNPATLNALVANAVEDVTIDDTLSTKDIARLANRFRSLEPDKVEMVAVPTTQGGYQGQSVLRLKQPDADTVLARFRGELDQPQQPAGPLPRIHPSTVRVRVLNGTGTSGQAGSAAAALRQSDFTIAGSPGEADRFTYTRTVIRYGAGQTDKARLLQAYLPGGAKVEQDTTLQGTDLVLVTGDDYEGVRRPVGATGAPAPAATPTTARPATTPTTGSTATSGKPKAGVPAAAQC